MPRTKTVLIVDDEPGMARALAAVLEDAGLRVETASNGEDAMRRLAEPDLPDMVLLDFLMPQMDGCATLRAIRDDVRLAALPVVMMSGVIESMIKRKCGTRKYDAFLHKPFMLDELLDVVETALGKPKRKPGTRQRRQT